MTVLVGLLITAATFMSWRVIVGRIQKSGAAMAHLAAGLIYVMVPLGFFGAVRVHWDVNGVLVLLAVCKFTDIGAYYTGKLLGGPKLAPRVSPNKTWAGAVGGIIGAVTVAIVLSVMDWTFLSEGEAAVYGLIMAAGAVIGDLCESVLKRESGINDSGHLLPGSGGVLDLVDDVLFAAPFTYIYFSLLSG
jgi:phosphatidate cytidylyltransferase